MRKNILKAVFSVCLSVFAVSACNDGKTNNSGNTGGGTAGAYIDDKTATTWCGHVMDGEKIVGNAFDQSATQKCIVAVNSTSCSSGKAAKVHALYECVVKNGNAGYTTCKDNNPVDIPCRNAMLGK